MSTAERIIAEHRDAGYLDGRRHCLCGWSTIDHDGIDPAAEHAAHVVAALTNAGKAIVDQAGQPDEEMAENEDEYGYKEWKTGVGRATAHTDDTVTIDSGYHFNVKPGDARDFAAALLAAARVAEGGDQP